MEYVYGALLLHAAGKEVDEEKLEKVLKEAGVKTDEARLKSLVASLKDVKIDEVLKNAAAVAATPVQAAPAAESKKHEGKKEEKKKEEEKPEATEEDAMAGLSSLFG
ncbi:MAG: 50S ribosomal protein P1 [Thermoplasmataceae archaeon]